jgi:Fe-S-cluster-containing hydrogenase component 2
MAKKILIDMAAYRAGIGSGSPAAEAVFHPFLTLQGLKSIRELAAFRFSCRRCTDAPCIGVCPSDALEKEPDGTISRALNLCVSCKSCVAICPFGTLMTDFFRFKMEKPAIFDLSDDEQAEKFIKASPEGSATWVEADEDPAEHIYALNAKILIREHFWDQNRL